MNLIQKYPSLLLALAGMFVLCGHAMAKDAYVVEEQGRSTWRVMFDRKMATSAEQWSYARETQNRGWLKKAERRMLYLVRRWPNSKEAPWAARARADMLFSLGEIEDAFAAYQYLIDNYSSRMADYDSVLESQYDIAVKIMNKRRLRWLFGGFRAPEYAVDYFEKVIRNGPQWERAAEAQFMIGKCYQEGKEYDLAISAYGLLGYRYPESRYAEESAWQQIVCLSALQAEYPNSPERLDRTLTATTVFLSTFPSSSYRTQIIQMRNELYEVKAQAVYDKATFYAKVPRKPRSAILYDQTLIEEFPKSKLVPLAEERVAELEAMLAAPDEEPVPVVPHAKPLPFG